MSGKKIRTTREYIRRIIIRAIIVTLAFAFLPLLLIVISQGSTSIQSDSPISAANSYLKETINDIDVTEAVSDGWSVAVIDEDLHVTSLGGDVIFDKSDLTISEWTEFLRSTGKFSDTDYEVTYHQGEDNYWLVMSRPRAVMFSMSLTLNPKADHFAPTVLEFAAFFLVYFIALLLFVIFFSKRTAKTVTGSIEKVSDGAKRIEKGDYDINLEPSGTAELDDLGKAVNRLAREIRSKEELQKEEEEKRMLLVSELSHDLKTPLASIQGYSEMLLRDVDEEKRKDYIQRIHGNSERANSILQSLFIYSKLENDSYKPTLEKTDLCEFTRQIMAEYIPRFEDIGFTYNIDVPDDEISIKLNAELFRRVFDNLLENSMKYNSTGTVITVSIATQDSKANIMIGDNGIGIPKDSADKIFTPFYRAANKTDGSGLGLAIVKRIVELHEGQITYLSDDKPGCRFNIVLPC